MKKSLVIVTCLSLVLILSLSMVSANWAGDFVGSIWENTFGKLFTDKEVQMAPGDNYLTNPRIFIEEEGNWIEISEDTTESGVFKTNMDSALFKFCIDYADGFELVDEVSLHFCKGGICFDKVMEAIPLEYDRRCYTTEDGASFSSSFPTPVSFDWVVTTAGIPSEANLEDNFGSVSVRKVGDSDNDLLYNPEILTSSNGGNSYEDITDSWDSSKPVKISEGTSFRLRSKIYYTEDATTGNPSYVTLRGYLNGESIFYESLNALSASNDARGFNYDDADLNKGEINHFSTKWFVPSGYGTENIISNNYQESYFVLACGVGDCGTGEACNIQSGICEAETTTETCNEVGGFCDLTSNGAPIGYSVVDNSCGVVSAVDPLICYLRDIEDADCLGVDGFCLAVGRNCVDYGGILGDVSFCGLGKCCSYELIPTTCTDGILNQDETGIDCGGVICPACSVIPTCTDGILNQDETGIDCGGVICPACSVDPCGDGTCDAATENCLTCVTDCACTGTDVCTAGVCSTGTICGDDSECIGQGNVCHPDILECVSCYDSDLLASSDPNYLYIKGMVSYVASSFGGSIIREIEDKCQDGKVIKYSCNSDGSGYDYTLPIDCLNDEVCAGGICIPSTQVVCGNSILEGDEECDDGNFCTGCVCDSGYQPTNPLSLNCHKIPVCGDEILDVGEECDGGAFCIIDGCACGEGYQSTDPISEACESSNSCAGVECPAGHHCLEGVCYPFQTGSFCDNPAGSGPGILPGTRVKISEVLNYCSPLSLDFEPVLGYGTLCNNDYECESNSCLDGVCTSIQGMVDEQIGLLQQIFCWVRYPLSKDNRGECLGLVEESSCKIDDDCVAGKVCNQGLCMTAGTCVTNFDCDDGVACVSGVCSIVPECGDNFCNGDETCLSCVEDCGCENNEECLDNFCVNENYCTPTKDCENYQYCDVDLNCKSKCGTADYGEENYRCDLSCLDGNILSNSEEACPADFNCCIPECVRDSSDLDHDGLMTTSDYGILGLFYDSENCIENNGWCGCADINQDSYVNDLDNTIYTSCLAASCSGTTPLCLYDEVNSLTNCVAGAA